MEWRPYETSRRDEQARRHEPTGDKTDDMTQRNAQERDATTRRHDETTNETHDGHAYGKETRGKRSGQRGTHRNERTAIRNGAYIFNTPGEAP